ncbi:hypothetical protein NIES4071_21040 [Calothrix sp. NIES-4071]|nr:hypothetical protein NIES4071_21040 [Calothrix sp. NIES-4071]BAZ56436.1 hypothetical protein NIES4105_20990 [Calothrix sp. NIES-4105]
MVSSLKEIILESEISYADDPEEKFISRQWTLYI